MSNPVLASSSTATVADAPLVISLPSGTAEGDELLLFATLYHTGSSQNINNPSGWTTRVNSESNFVSKACWTKTATAGDISTGSVTLTSTGGSDHFSGSLHRITGAASGSEVSGSEFDAGGTTSSVATFTTALTPATAESLIVIYFGGGDTSLTAAPTGTSYSLTPTTPLTENADVGREVGSVGIAHVVASGAYNGTTEITSRGFTLSENITRGPGSIAILYSAPQDATTDISHLAITPTVESLTASNTATATINHIELTPTLDSLTATSGSDRTQWTNNTKNSTTWTNENKSS